jgi:hypothetical protein
MNPREVGEGGDEIVRARVMSEELREKNRPGSLT